MQICRALTLNHLFLLSDSAEVHISKAIQKVCLEVNEDGSEAAASTGKDTTECLFSLSGTVLIDLLYLISLTVMGTDDHCQQLTATGCTFYLPTYGKFTNFHSGTAGDTSNIKC